MLTEWLIFPLAVRSRGHSLVATCGFSPAAGSRGYFSLRRLLSLQSMGSRRTGLVAPCHVEPSRTRHQARVLAAWAGRSFSTGHRGGPAEWFFRSRGPAGLVQMSAGSTCQQGGLVSRSAGDSPGLLPGATGYSPKRAGATKNSLSCPASKPTPYHSCHIPLAKESYKASLGSGGEIDSQSHVTRVGFCYVYTKYFILGY